MPSTNADATLDPLAGYLSLRERLSEGTEPLRGSWVLLTGEMDSAVRALTETDTSFAAVALGSYGRCQLCVHSDIDLMILVPADVTVAPAVFRALWDAGLSVGHAVRTPTQAAAAAAERTDTLCSLLDARLICGDEALFGLLESEIRSVAHPKKLRAALAAEELERRDAEPHHLQAMDLKSGRGGLRALHGVRWARLVAGWADDDSRAPQTDDENDLGQLEQTFLEARQAVHIAAGRAHDALDFSLRRPAAKASGLDAKAFLTAVYLTARSADLAVTNEFGPLLLAAHGTRTRRGLLGRKRSDRADRGVDNVSTRTHPFVIACDAIARDSQTPELTAAELEAIATFTGPTWDADARGAFTRLACAGPGARRLLDQLRSTGFLEQAIPEWIPVVSQAQLDPFHVHPVDDHLLRTAAQVVALTRGDTADTWTAQIADELGSVDEVVLGALFHDIGKGTGRDHSVAGAEIFEAFATRAGFDKITIDVVTLLIREHLLLPEVATRNDLDDPAVIDNVASRVGDADVLRMLYLITIADALATGPDVWSSWRASLARTLFIRTMDAIASDDSRPTPMRTARITEVSERWSGELDPDRIADHLRTMPEAYALRTPAVEVRRHLMLLDPLPEPNDARIDVVDTDEWSDLALVAADRTGLLALVSGVLAVSNISIREARLATRTDGIVVDRLHVVDSLHSGPVDGDRWPRVMSDLRGVLRGDLSVGDMLDSKHHHYRSRVDTTFAPEAKIFFGADHGTHRIELRGADRVGLLHDVSRVFQDEGVDVHFAKIDTQGGRVVDTFHVNLAADLDHDDLTARLLEAARVPT